MAVFVSRNESSDRLLDSGQVTDLTPIDGIQARVGQVRANALGAGGFSPGSPNEILVATNDRLPQFHDYYLIDLDTGNRRMVQQASEDAQFFMFDQEYEVRFGLRASADGGAEETIRTPDGGWTLFRKIEIDDVMTYFPVGFDKTGRVRYMRDSGGRDTVAVVATNLDTMEAKVVAHDPKTDVSDVLVHPTDKSIQAVAFTYERKTWEVLDDSIGTDMEYLSSLADGEMEFVSRTLDDRKWVVGFQADIEPQSYFLYDKLRRRADFLFSDREDVRGHPLARMHTAVIQIARWARPGELLHAAARGCSGCTEDRGLGPLGALIRGTSLWPTGDRQWWT